VHVLRFVLTDTFGGRFPSTASAWRSALVISGGSKLPPFHVSAFDDAVLSIFRAGIGCTATADECPGLATGGNAALSTLFIFSKWRPICSASSSARRCASSRFDIVFFTGIPQAAVDAKGTLRTT
jgi:hypothetical protein